MATDGHVRAGSSAPPLKVMGLGAPTSVRIFFDLAEVPALLEAIGDELARHGCGSQIKGRIVEPKTGVDPADWRYHVGELHRMLGDVEQAAAPRYAFDVLEVLWPTVLAHGVVNAAVAHAERRARESSGRDAEEGLAAAQRTLRDYQAVDGGGLLDVWL